MVRLGLKRFLNAGMEEADIGNRFDHGLAFNGQYQAQYTMCAGLLRSHIDGHDVLALLLSVALAILNGVAVFYLLSLHIIWHRVVWRDIGHAKSGSYRLLLFVVPGS